MARAEPPELQSFLEPFPDEVRAVVRALRKRVLTTMPNAHEVVWDATNAVSLVYTPTRRWQDGICHIATYAQHVNLGFNNGAHLEDPLGVLVGTGAHIRHVTFRTTGDTKASWIAAYLQNALAGAAVTADAGDRGTTIRMSKGAKRRPS